MSTLNTTNIKHTANTGDPNLVLDTAGNVVINGDAQMQSQNDGPLAGLRNLLVNGRLYIWQRGNGPFSSGYSADRWLVAGPGSVNQGSTAAFGNYSLDLTTAGTSWISQMIEGGNAPIKPGTTWTISFHSTVKPDKVLCFWGDKAGDPSNRVAVADIDPTPIASDASVQRYQATFTSSVTPVASNIGFEVVFQFSSNASISDMQLEPGLVATPFEIRPIGMELSLCQRFFQTGATGAVSYAASAGAVQRGWASFPTTMRITPDVGMVINSAAPGISSPQPVFIDARSGFLYGFASTGAGLDGTFYFTADAEL